MKFSKFSPSNSPKPLMFTKYGIIDPKIPPEFPKSDKLLFCFDWDQTLVKGHMDHHISSVVCSSFRPYSEQDKNKMVDNFLSDVDKGWRNKKDVIELFQIISDLGHHLAITSFCPYSSQIKYALSNLICQKNY